MYNYNHLYYFYTTVKSEGVTSAAKHLCISQPSLSGQLKVLEDFLQIKLFAKVGRKNQLTPEGALVYGFCRRMFELSEQMHEMLEEQEPCALRKIYIGVTDEIPNSFTEEIVSHFLNKYEEQTRPRVVMVSGEHESLAEQLMFKEIDVLLTSFPTGQPDLENLQSIEVPVNLFCTLNEQISLGERTAQIDVILDLINEQKEISWVMPQQGSKLRSETNSFFEVNHIKGRIVFESDVLGSLARSVLDDMGIALLPLIYAPRESQGDSLYILGPKEGYWKHSLWIASHINNKDDKPIQNLSQSFNDVCENFLRQNSWPKRKEIISS